MARMRSLKPEFWHDQEITRLPRDARLLYMALWNLADEHSRLQGDPRYIKGQAFPYDDDLTAADIDEMIDRLVDLGKTERYVVRGAVYLLLPKLAKHQRLDTDKVPSRLPGPDESEPQSESRADSSEKVPDQGANESALSMWHVAGGREHVAGSMEQVSTTSGAARTETSTQTIVAEWMERAKSRPPGQVIGQASKLIRQMLEEGIAPDDIRRGLSAWMDKGLHPSALPSVVNEVMNAAPTSTRRRGTDDKVRDGLALAQRLAAQEANQPRQIGA